MDLYVLFWSLFFVMSTTHGWYTGRDYRLERKDPVSVGHEAEIKLNVRRQLHKVKTLSVNPPIFEVQNFLTPEECEYLIFLAKRAGLNESPVHEAEIRDFQTTPEVFAKWDVNNDSFVEPAEFTFIQNKGNLYLTEVEMTGMLANLNIDKNDDNKMDFNEFQTVTAERIGQFFQHISRNYPRLRNRLSKQAWIWHHGAKDQLLEGFHERISRLTGLPHDLIEVSEPMQVSTCTTQTLFLISYVEAPQVPFSVLLYVNNNFKL